MYEHTWENEKAEDVRNNILTRKQVLPNSSIASKTPISTSLNYGKEFEKMKIQTIICWYSIARIGNTDFGKLILFFTRKIVFFSFHELKPYFMC